MNEPSQDVVDAFSDMSRLGERSGLPRQWIYCPICGAYSWVMPPHGLDPCPVAVANRENLDAQRMAHIRSGVSMTDMTTMLREMFGKEVDE